MGFGDSINLGLDQAVQAVQSAAGIVSATQNTVGVIPLPWEISTINSQFFQSIKIDPSRWDELFPYRLMVIDSTTNTVVYGSKGTVTVGVLSNTITITPGTGSALISFDTTQSPWIMQLPITPQQLTIQDQYAINVSATLRGILEEHSGVRFKIINAQGTMGVWPQRSSVTTTPSTPGIIPSIFGGTIQALGSVVQQVNGVVNSFISNNPNAKPTSLRPETSTFGQTSTGYYQALKLEQFLEQYAEAKKNPACATWRLVFDIPKQNQSLVVTPMMYDWVQNALKPMEIQYRFQLKAWRRVNLNQRTASVAPNNQPISPGILQRVLATISQSRQTLSSVVNLIHSVTSDAQTVFSVLQQTSLFVKDLAGAAVTAADLPVQLVSDFNSAISTSLANVSQSVTTFNSISNLYSQTPTAATSNADNTLSFNSTSVASSDTTARQNLAAITATQSQNEGLSMSAVSGGQLGSDAATMQSLSTVNNIFSNPDANYALLDQAPLSSLTLTNAQQNTVNQLIQNARETTIAELKQYRNTILQLALLLSNSFGTGSAYYNDLFSLPPPTPRLQPITLDEYDILKTLYDTMVCYDILTASTEIDDNNVQTAMQFVAGLASNADIPFDVTSSKVLAPVPFGLTMEAISARYLGDPNRWIEIATLNGLREPYIDENGFQVPLLSNAIGRQAFVGSDTNLYVGQTVIFNSTTQPMSPRTILNIEQLSDTSFLLTLDGLANLDNFIVSNKAYIQAYLPGTVNSQQKIYIPSDLPVPNVSNIIPPSITSADPLTAISKVDILLTDTGDIASNNYGDWRYSWGITNIIQALRIKFGTIAGTILTDPNFGLGVKTGTISSELQIQQLYNSINNMVVQDPRFQQVVNLQINLNGPVLGISMGVTIPNQTGVFPVSFALTA
jgi:hypothetical protein